MIFGNNTWDLCTAERGLAVGELMNGNLLWTIGPPREGMLGNEVSLLVWNVDNDIGRAYVTGYLDGTPVLKQVSNYDNYDTVTPFEYTGEPIPFGLYELTACLNL